MDCEEGRMPKNAMMLEKTSDGERVETVTDFIWASKSLQMVTASMKLKDACSLEGKL